jgi:DNA-binding MarR family transcriptional regulator
MDLWLTDEESRAWFGYRVLSVLLEDYLDQQLRRDAGISHNTYTLLTRLAAEPGGRLRLSELARTLGITRSRLSHALGTLEAAGWVTRSTDPNDRRGQLAELTAKGRTVQAEAAPGHVAAVRHAVFNQLTPGQVEELATISEVIVNAMLNENDASSQQGTAPPWRRR